jgi:hypothetical protein
MTRPIRDVDVPLTQLQSDLRRLLAEQRLQASVERLGWLIAHPESAATPATAGETAEYRHLLYDADEDATTPAFPYPTCPPEEAS